MTRSTIPWWKLAIPLAAAAVLGLLAVTGESGKDIAESESIRQFLHNHWQTPIPPQGDPPAGFSELEASLLPESCGSCHPQQYRDWRGSLHARAMGPGVLGQTVVMERSDPAGARLCWSCHAPLSEQQPVVLQASTAGEQLWVNNPDFDPLLQRHGLSCAACHVRGHRRFGPPRRAAPDETGAVDEGLPHGGFTAEPAFSRSEFCKECHQFGPDGYALNGKLIENTYQEWLESGYPAKGVECQSCHMPQRRHLWRGIHDPQMTRSGVTITVAETGGASSAGGQAEAVLTVTNSGTGHLFPTYLTPRLVISGRQLDSGGREIGDTMQQMVIGWEVTLDLRREIFDTRIPPGESVVFRYRKIKAPEAHQLLLRVRVEPDYFYERFFRALLEGDSAGEGRELIREAWENARSTPYTLFEERITLRY